MSRNLKRVPLDFAWPLDEIWEGYVNPHRDKAEDCAACDRSGYAPRAKLFYDQWYGCAPFDAADYGAEPLRLNHPAIVALAERNVGHYHGRGLIEREVCRLHDMWSHQWCHNLIQADVDALVANNSLYDFTRRPLNDEQRAWLEKQAAAGGSPHWLSEPNGYIPTAAEINDWSMRGLGHDSINALTCVRARCEREGVPVMCPECGGHGYTMSPEDRAARDAWVETEPPAGDGYQLWEDVTEGSPQSPVFATLDELCAWCEENATTFAHHRATAAEWKQMFAEGNVHHREGNIIFM